MMMMHGLLDKSIPPFTLTEGENRENYLVLDNIANYYYQWMVSPPFDIGYTTRYALSASTQGAKPTWKRISQKASKHNESSLSNGSLMRSTPMVVYTSLLEPSEARKCIDDEVAFTHPNQTAKDALYLYAIAIHYLINNPTDKDRAQKAFDLVYSESASMVSYVCQKSG